MEAGYTPQELILKYYFESKKVNAVLLSAGTIIIIAGLLMMWFAEKQIFTFFAIGLFVSTPLILLKALVDRRFYSNRIKSISNASFDQLLEKQILVETHDENQKHKKICIYAMSFFAVIAILSGLTISYKMYLASILSLLFILALEYINNLIEDYRIDEIKYRLDRP